MAGEYPRSTQRRYKLVNKVNKVPSNQELEVQQRYLNSPHYSVKKFEELRLRTELLEGIYAMGFNRPSKIQATALPLLLANPPENMIAQSQSGTGKTAAFVLTMLSRIKTDKVYPQCLCLSPTYELALQTGKVVELMGKFLPGLKVAYAVKGNKVQRNTHIAAQIVIGTPGTTISWIRMKAFDVSKIDVFVLDEADVMIASQGFRDHSIRIHKLCPKSCQYLLFSATYDESVMKFAQQVVSMPNIIRLRREEETLVNIKQYYVKCSTVEKKYESLVNLLYTTLTVGQAVIFCHTRRTASWVANKMREDQFIVALLSSELEITQRASVLKRFKDAKERVLVTTYVCWRGIDLEQVTLVVNFDLTIKDQFGRADCETYLHRIGRTGRFGKSGVAINFVTDENDMKILNDIERHFGIIIQTLDTDSYVDMEAKLGDQDNILTDDSDEWEGVRSESFLKLGTISSDRLDSKPHRRNHSSTFLNRTNQEREQTTTNQEREQTTTNQEREQTTTNQEREQTTTNQEREQTTTNQEREQTTTNQEREQTTTNQEREQTTTNQEREQTTTNQEREQTTEQTTTNQEREQTTTNQEREQTTEQTTTNQEREQTTEQTTTNQERE